jgi:hypothetical protein
MKRKLAAVALASVLCLSLPLTAAAAGSSDKTNNSSSTTTTTTAATTTTTTPSQPVSAAEAVKDVKAGEAVKAETIQVQVVAADGTVSNKTLDEVVTEKAEDVVATITVAKTTTAATPAEKKEAAKAVAESIKSTMTGTVSEAFTATIEFLVEGLSDDQDIVANNMGTYKTAATAPNALGGVNAAITVDGASSEWLMMLVGTYEDGTTETVEGAYDSLGGTVVGAFTGAPAAITVVVIAYE